MKTLSTNEIRELFLSYFEKRGHLRLPSAALVPKNDKSLLLINSGMAPFKSYFTGIETPPSKRVVTCQKCIRTEDLDNVGRTIRHGTFFEMLGNFSFGDYFKIEAIEWSWDFITKVLNLDEDKLFISVYEDDDESYEIWNKKMNIDKSKIVKLGKEDNFWEVGVGPCGPCSEIYYDLGEEYSCGKEDCFVGCECDRYIEFWNLVFTQLYKEEDGTYSDLEHPNIDTGMGLERISAIMQGEPSIFDIDVSKDVIEYIQNLVGEKNLKNKSVSISYKVIDISLRVIADHIKSVVFLISDGVMPSNEGRGYVLRRLLRRALRHAKLLGINELFFTDLADIIIGNYKDAYKNLEEKRDFINKIIRIEEERFLETLENGMILLNDIMIELSKNEEKAVSGKDMFKLYDTFGFPLDLTKEILDEKKFEYDEKGFNIEMEAQRQRAKDARVDNTFLGSKASSLDILTKDYKSEFVGYDSYDSKNSKVLAIINEDALIYKFENTKDEVFVIFDRTPFYAEGGGQIGDRGFAEKADSKIKVLSTFSTINNTTVHKVKLLSGSIKVGDLFDLEININKRKLTSKNHSATHLVHKALKEVLGTHVEQAGSLVDNEKLRFDFIHFEGLKKEDLLKVEDIVNQKILDDLEVSARYTDLETAIGIGAEALFEDKYKEEVRVVSMGDFSTELCGGTHVKNTSEIGVFKILSESSIAAGVRRIEALTSLSLLNKMREQENQIKIVEKILKTPEEKMIEKITQFLSEHRELKQKLDRMKNEFAKEEMSKVFDDIESIKGVSIAIAKLDGFGMNELRQIADDIKNQNESYVIMLASQKDDKVQFVAMISDDLIKEGFHAGSLVKEAAKITGGTGGGRPNMAQAGGKDASKINEALKHSMEIVEKLLE